MFESLFGAEMPLSAFVSGIGPGVVLVADYTRAQFGSFDVNVPCTAPGSLDTSLSY